MFIFVFDFEFDCAIYAVMSPELCQGREVSFGNQDFLGINK